MNFKAVRASLFAEGLSFLRLGLPVGTYRINLAGDMTFEASELLFVIFCEWSIRAVTIRVHSFQAVTHVLSIQPLTRVYFT